MWQQLDDNEKTEDKCCEKWHNGTQCMKMSKKLSFNNWSKFAQSELTELTIEIKMTNKKIASETKCTVVVVGDSRTGKSALLQRFVHKNFQPVSLALFSSLRIK